MKTSHVFYTLPKDFKACCDKPDLRRQGFNSANQRRVWCVNCDSHYTVTTDTTREKCYEQKNWTGLTIPLDTPEMTAEKKRRLNNIPSPGSWEVKNL